MKQGWDDEERGGNDSSGHRCCREIYFRILIYPQSVDHDERREMPCQNIDKIVIQYDKRLVMQMPFRP